MKTKLFTLVALLLTGVTALSAQTGKTLVAYFSWSGNTQYVAQ